MILRYAIIATRLAILLALFIWWVFPLDGLGAWMGMQVFHHKTAKESFQRRFWLVK